RLGRLIGGGACLLEGLVGLEADGNAIHADLAFLDSAKKDTQRLKRYRDDLKALRPMPSMSDRMFLSERFTLLDAIISVERYGVASLADHRDGEKSPPLNLISRHLTENVNWDPALKKANYWCERIGNAMRARDQAAWVADWAEIDAQLRAMR